MDKRLNNLINDVLIYDQVVETYNGEASDLWLTIYELRMLAKITLSFDPSTMLKTKLLA